MAVVPLPHPDSIIVPREERRGLAGPGDEGPPPAHPTQPHCIKSSPYCFPMAPVALLGPSGSTYLFTKPLMSRYPSAQMASEKAGEPEEKKLAGNGACACACVLPLAEGGGLPAPLVFSLSVRLDRCTHASIVGPSLAIHVRPGRVRAGVCGSEKRMWQRDRRPFPFDPPHSLPQRSGGRGGGGGGCLCVPRRGGGCATAPSSRAHAGGHCASSVSAFVGPPPPSLPMTCLGIT